MIRFISATEVQEAVCRLFISANHKLPQDVLDTICRAKEREENKRAESILTRLCENASTAEKLDDSIESKLIQTAGLFLAKQLEG